MLVNSSMYFRLNIATEERGEAEHINSFVIQSISKVVETLAGFFYKLFKLLQTFISPFPSPPHSMSFT